MGSSQNKTENIAATENKLKKKYYKDFFSKNNEVEKWHDHYHTENITSYAPKMRLKQTIDWINEYKAKNKSGIVLDLGCGAGVTSRAIEGLNYRVIGLDQAFFMLAKAKKNTESAKRPVCFLQGDIESLPFRTNSFDFIVCLGVISYLDFGQNAVSEIARILKPKGVVILSYLRKIGMLELPLKIYRTLKKRQDNTDQFELRRYSIDTIRNLFNSNGLSLISNKAIEYSYLSLSWRKFISTALAWGIHQFLIKRSHKYPFNRIGDMYLLKAEKNGLLDNKLSNQMN